MSALSELYKKLTDKQYREAFVSAQIKRVVPMQIRSLRNQRHWKQTDLAEAAGLTQGAISRAEDPDYGNLTINNLLRIAAGFDVAFVGRFVSFSELGKWYVNLSDEKSLMVPSFADDCGFIERKPAQSECGSAEQAREVGQSSPRFRGIFQAPDPLGAQLNVGQNPEQSPDDYYPRFSKTLAGAAAARLRQGISA